MAECGALAEDFQGTFSDHFMTGLRVKNTHTAQNILQQEYMLYWSFQYLSFEQKAHHRKRLKGAPPAYAPPAHAAPPPAPRGLILLHLLELEGPGSSSHVKPSPNGCYTEAAEGRIVEEGDHLQPDVLLHEPLLEMGEVQAVEEGLLLAEVLGQQAEVGEGQHHQADHAQRSHVGKLYNIFSFCTFHSSSLLLSYPPLGTTESIGMSNNSCNL